MRKASKLRKWEKIKDIVYILRPQLLLLCGVYLLLFFIPNRNIISVNLCVLIPVMLYKISRQKPRVLEWIKTFFKTIFFTTVFILLFSFLGGIGIIGLILTIIIIVALRIKKGWRLYSYTTSWGAKVLKGEYQEFDTRVLENSLDPLQPPKPPVIKSKDEV